MLGPLPPQSARRHPGGVPLPRHQRARIRQEDWRRGGGCRQEEQHCLRRRERGPARVQRVLCQVGVEGGPRSNEAGPQDGHVEAGPIIPGVNTPALY